MDIEKKLGELVAQATKALGEQLESIVLYGSAARNEFDSGHSDLNVLILTRELNLAQLQLAAPFVKGWMEAGNPQPLLFTSEEFSRSADAFPIEIIDMQKAHRVLYGADPLAGMTVDATLHRAQLEHEIRSKLLRLRQKAMPILDSHKDLLRLMEDSVTTFLLFLRHMLILKGQDPPISRRALVAAAHGEGLIEPIPFAQLIDLREGKLSPKAVDSVQLFEDYLRQIQVLVASIDAH
ncbi:MAG: nucleotidyltransferase domain-containing protein [Chloroflexia bacterium]